MDIHLPWIASGFISGWLAKEFLTPKAPEVPTCNCLCNWSGHSTAEGYWNRGVGAWVALAVIVLGIILSHTALAFQIRFKDNQSGADRTFTFSSKGKGVYGSKGLPISG